jgi:hypothetical protein
MKTIPNVNSIPPGTSDVPMGRAKSGGRVVDMVARSGEGDSGKAGASSEGKDTDAKKEAYSFSTLSVYTSDLATPTCRNHQKAALRSHVKLFRQDQTKIRHGSCNTS